MPAIAGRTTPLEALQPISSWRVARPTNTKSLRLVGYLFLVCYYRYLGSRRFGFASDSARIGSAGQQRLREFFQQTNAVSYTIVGHTDSRASDEYNIGLSLRRANAVAAVAQSAGARIADVRGYGERMPRASNNTAAGMAQNRRVEILCWR